MRTAITNHKQTLLASKTLEDGRYKELGYSPLSKPDYAYVVFTDKENWKSPTYKYFPNEVEARSHFDAD